MENELYWKISKAREACAGCNIQSFAIVRRLIEEAIEYLSSKPTLCPDITTIRLLQLEEALSLIEKAKEYGDRLKPDAILCEILNEMLVEG